MKRIISIRFTVLFIIVTNFMSCSNEGSQGANLSIPYATVFFKPAGGTINVPVSCDQSWTVSDTADWCSQSVQSGEGDGTFILTVQANDSLLGRSAAIFVKADKVTRQMIVKQDGALDSLYDIAPDNTDMRNLPTIELAQEMKIGWNVGNSLDAVGGETAWGNPKITQLLIDSVKAAGFNAVRIPVAWSKFSNEATFTIQNSWMNRVEEVVNYVLDDGMYAIINIHWDGGWMQPTSAQEEYVDNRLAAMWKQIATHFRDYNDHLLFAGTNEVMVEGDYGTPTQEYYTVQNGFNQTFVSTVRATGGRNVYRYLLVQGFNTNIDYTVNFAVMPTDVVEDRLMMEVHYYDPYNFTINTDTSNHITQWGMNATDPSRTETWANEAYADGQFQKMKTKFIDKGIAVILGEYGTIARNNVPDYAPYRQYYMEYITQSMVNHGLIPFYWDNGYTGDYGMGIFDRNTGKRAYPEIVQAIIKAVK